jgi:hypothetical protein
MKNWKSIFAVVGIMLFVCSAVAACIVYWDRLRDFFSALSEKCCAKPTFTSEEYSDFADI